MTARPIRLGLFAAAPVYYQVPLYRRLAEHPGIDFTAIFASSAAVRPHDGGFGRLVTWDVDLLSGYRHIFLRKSHSTPEFGSFLTLRDIDIVRRILIGRYDVLWIHGYNFLTHVLAACAQRVRRGGVLFREEQTLLHPRGCAKAAGKRAALPVLFHGACALYIGTENRRWFTRYGVSADRLFFVPYCVDNGNLQSAAIRLRGGRRTLLKRFGIAEDSGPVILTVSRLIPKKQPLQLLEAFRRVRGQLRCTLLVVGSGELQNAMERKVAHERIPDVCFTGFLNQSEVPSAYACGDIFVLFSYEHETWGVAINEAMNFSLPIVASNKVGSATDLVQDGVNGFIVNRCDVGALADRLTTLAQQPGLRESFGQMSRARINQWTYDVAERGICDAAARLTGRRPDVT